jgi:hypothetical protein
VDLLVVDPITVVCLFAVGGAFLALWVLARFPTWGPQRVRSATAAATVALVLETPMIAFMGWVRHSMGVVPALLFVALPSFTLMFWFSGCLLRSLAGMIAPYRR